jgi:hypothetical protein
VSKSQKAVRIGNVYWEGVGVMALCGAGQSCDSSEVPLPNISISLIISNSLIHRRSHCSHTSSVSTVLQETDIPVWLGFWPPSNDIYILISWEVRLHLKCIIVQIKVWQCEVMCVALKTTWNDKWGTGRLWNFESNYYEALWNLSELHVSYFHKIRTCYFIESANSHMQL